MWNQTRNPWGGNHPPLVADVTKNPGSLRVKQACDTRVAHCAIAQPTTQSSFLAVMWSASEERHGLDSCFSLDGIPRWSLGPCSSVAAESSFGPDGFTAWSDMATEFKFINSLAVYSSIQTPCIADNLANVACVRSAPVVRLTFQHPAAWKTLKILGAMPW